MFSFRTHLSLLAVEAEAGADARIRNRALEMFVTRERMNSYLAQFIFAIVAVAGYSLGSPTIACIGIAHVLIDQIVRVNLDRFSPTLQSGRPDPQRLKRIEQLFYLVGVIWAAPACTLAESLDGLRLLLAIVSVAGLLVMANTTCFAPRVFRASMIGYGLALLGAVPAITTMPRYLFAVAVAAFLVVVTAIAAGTARQLLNMLRMQVERDEAIEGQERTIADLDLARCIATTMAETDSLTGLANRLLFMRKLDALVASGQPLALTLLDIDLFKNINDGLGHNVGDDVLRTVARVLDVVQGSECFAARLGGDEFAVIVTCESLAGGDIFASVRLQIERLLGAVLELPSISITGGSAYFPGDAGTASELLAAADIAQREAKRVRRGGHLDYSLDLSNRFWREAQIAHAISQAIASREIVLFFQPKVDLETGRVVGAETLSRFTLEALSGYSLDEIFDVAEKRGLGTVLDELVLDRYREALVDLRDRFSVVMPTSVNLSGAILKAPDKLIAKLRQLIAEGLDPAMVRVEITENAIYGRGQIGVVELLGRIVALGFSLALDDFGTGSGALRQLVNLPVAEIKIDRSFVSGMKVDAKNRAIIKGLIVTGQDMGLEIVVEGVETEQEAEILRAMGARLAQGYLWSPAVPVAQVVHCVRMFGVDCAADQADLLACA